MKGRLTRSKVSPKSHKKIVAFVYAEKLSEEDIPKMKYYLKKRKDLHLIYLVVSKSPSTKVITACNRYNHLKLIHSTNPEKDIADIKKQFDGTEVKFRKRKFEDLQDRSL